MRTSLVIPLVLALGLGCGGRHTRDLELSLAEAAPLRPSALAVRSDPPLPGESLAGWSGLDPEASADATGRLDLVAALRLAAAQNPGLDAVRFEAEAARWSATRARRLPNPEVELEGYPFGPTLEWEGRVELDLTDVLLTPGRGRVARYQAQAASLESQEATVRLVAEVTVAWWGVVAAEQRLAIGQRALDGLAAARDAARARVEAGNAPALELAAQDAAYVQAQGTVAGLELDRELSRSRLDSLLGLTGSDAAWEPLVAFPALPEAVVVGPELEQQAVAASLGLQATEARLESLARQGRVARAEGGLPDVSVGLMSRWEAAADLQAEGEWAVGVGMRATLPVLSGGRASGRAWDATFDAEAARGRGMLVDTAAATRGAQASLASTHARAVHEREVVLPAFRRVTAETLLQYNAMQVGIYELLSARGQELEAELRHAGTFMYHPHYDEMTQMALGMAGMFIVHPKVALRRVDRDFVLMTHEWKVEAGAARPDAMAMNDFNLLTFNSRAFPGTQPLLVGRGERVRIRFGNLSAMDHHPIHLHGLNFQVTGTDGGEIPRSAWIPETSVLVPVGSTRVIEFVADEPGDWAMHCHMTHHVMTQMGHAPASIGADMGRVDHRMSRVMPEFMTMGTDGMGAMVEMEMDFPPNSLPMRGTPGPFSTIDMGGMFTILKVRQDPTVDPDGWFVHPPGTVAALADAAAMKADGVDPSA